LQMDIDLGEMESDAVVFPTLMPHLYVHDRASKRLVESARMLPFGTAGGETRCLADLRDVQPMPVTGHLSKMSSELAQPVNYALKTDESETPLNKRIGQSIALEFSGRIHCTHCGRATNKSFNQGFCFPCSQRLAQCDMCILKPERCHYDAGTCREPEWGERNCLRPHVVYLANSSGLKVGITRGSQVPTRWIDQGASQALPIFEVETRLQSGLIEVALANHVADKTNWRNMLKGSPEPIPLGERRDQLLHSCAEPLQALTDRFGTRAIRPLPNAATVEIDYPVSQYPTTVRPLNLDKTPRVQGTLLGIKGQYLILDTGVLNVRKYTGYEVTLAD